MPIACSRSGVSTRPRRARGDEIGVSDWHLVTQESVDRFADVTGDHYFIHTDPERAKETPFGGTIAHGYYTLSLAPKFAYALVRLRGLRLRRQLRLQPRALPGADARRRARAHAHELLAKVEEIPGGAQITSELTFEREGGDKPVCVAESLSRVYA